MGIEPKFGFIHPCVQQLYCGRWFDCFGFTSCGVAGILGAMLGDDTYEPLPVMMGRPSVCQHCLYSLPKRQRHSITRQVHAGKVQLLTRHEMVDLVLVDGRARGIVARDLVSGRLVRLVADAVILATGGYSRVFFLSTNAMNCNVSAAWACYKQGAGFANPCFTQIHPTCIPVHGTGQSKLTLMSESLRNDGRVWVPRKTGDERTG